MFAEVDPIMDGAVENMRLVALTFEDVDFARLLRPVVNILASCIFDRNQPEGRPCAFDYIPPQARFEITVTPGRIVSCVRGKSGDARVYAPLLSLPFQTEHRISRGDISSRRVLVTKPDAFVPRVYSPTV